MVQLMSKRRVQTGFGLLCVAAAASASCRDNPTEPLDHAPPIRLPAAPTADAGPQQPMRFGDWSAPTNLGATVNSASNDQGAAISKDERSLYFISTRQNPQCPVAPCDNDIWVSRRAHKDDPWGPPVNLEAINTSGLESTPALSRDGRRLYFASNRAGSVPLPGSVSPSIDIWVSERADTRDDLGWQPPVNLGPAINSPAGDLGPAPFVDPETERLTLFFYSTRSGGPGTGLRDIYRSAVDDNGTFTPAVLVSELSTPYEDEQPSVRRDGLEIFFASNRPGTLSSTVTDIWVSTRASTSEAWSEPVSVGAVINTTGLEARPELSFDGRSLYFFSNGRGGIGSTDLFVSARRKIGDDPE